MPKTGIPTTRDISQASGYSQSAVSHALRGTHNVSAGTRQKILTVARKMGWRPNPFASAYMAHLRSQRRPRMQQAALAFLISNPLEGRLTGQLPHIQQHYVGAKARAEELGFGLESFWMHEPHLTGRRLTSILRSRSITGLIAPGLVEPARIFKELDWRQFSAVAMGFTPSKSDMHRVTADTFDGFALVLERMRGLGYRKIAVAVSDAYDEQVNHGVHYSACFARERWQGEHEISICRFATDEEKEIPQVQAWLANHRPEIVLGEDLTWRAIQRMGWRVPQDLAFVNVDWSEKYPDIAGFNQRHELHGSVAVDILVAQIMQNERGLPPIPRVVLVPGAWAAGASAPPVAGQVRKKTSRRTAPLT